MKKFKLLVLSSLFTLFLFVPALVSAQQSGLQISPIDFNFEIDKGGQESGKVVVTNINDQTTNYQLEAEDFINVSDDGAPSFAGIVDNEDISTLSTWITFAGDISGELAAKESIDVYFTIDVPKDAEPGGHYAAVFAKQNSGVEDGSTEIGVSSRVGALILVSVPGVVSKDAEITEFSPPSFIWRGPLDFTMKVENTGSVHYDSEGNVVIEPTFGTTAEIEMGTHTIIPNNTRNFLGTWSKRFPFGYYTVTAQATDGNGELIAVEKVIWALPLEIVIPALILLIIIIWAAKSLKKKYKIVSNK